MLALNQVSTNGIASCNLTSMLLVESISMIGLLLYSQQQQQQQH